MLYTVDLKQFPLNELVAFERATLKPSDVHVANFEINPYLLSLVDTDGVRYIFPGVYKFKVEELEQNFTISGTAPVKVSTCTSAPLCMAC